MSEPPGPANDFAAAHTALMRASLRRWAGRDIVPATIAENHAGYWLYRAPFALLAHGLGAQPLFTYGNITAQALFDMNWEQLMATPSVASAAPADRAERAALLARVKAHGFVDDYSGVRVSRTGRRFAIHRALVWNRLDATGGYRGQAALFSEWTPLPDAEA